MKVMKNKILMFAASGGGGAEKVTLIYTKLLYRAGADVTMVVLNTSNKDIYKFIPSYINVKQITSKSHLGRYFQIIKMVSKEKPNVVFSSATALSAVLVLCKILKGQLRVITRQCFTPGTKSAWVEKTIACLFNHADANVAQTEEMRQEMIKRYHLLPNKVWAIYNPLDTEDILTKTNGVVKKTKIDYSYITIGRLDPQKDYVTLLKAFSEVLEEKNNAKLTIIGSKRAESYYSQIMTSIETLQLSYHVTFVDYTDNPFQYLLESNCFVLSSVTEGLPNVLLEAMYLGVPCVATRSIPFISQAITDGDNGYTVNVGDFHALAEAMLKAPLLVGKVKNESHSLKSEKQILDLFLSKYL